MATPTSKHPAIEYGKIGVLLINLGTPNAPTAKGVRKFLREFLNDPRVIEINPVLWQIILRGFILPFRPQRTAKAYQEIWDSEYNQSPLKVITDSQANALQAKFNHNEVIIEWGMRYGTPSINDKIASLKKLGCDKILFCPLYPQYSATTTASAQDAIFSYLQELRWQGGLRFLPPYYDHAAYIHAIAESIKAQAYFDSQAPKSHPHAEHYDMLLLSFHGLPQRNLELGDPYYCHCHKSARLIREALRLDEKQAQLAFQSRFGKAQWLTPYSDKLVQELAQNGIKKLAVACPGFAADCLETLEEVGIRLKNDFIKAGGEQLTLIPCLNDSPLGIDMLYQLIEQELQGWH